MSSNFLEQLVAEWYEVRGYFVRRNVHVGPRPKGGYEGELDVVAFNPTTSHLVHIEPSADADPWDERERRFTKKFESGRKYVPAIFHGLSPGESLEQIALLVLGAKGTRTSLGGGKLVFVGEFIEEIFRFLKDRRLAKNAIPEQFPLLRSFQFVAEYFGHVSRGLQKGTTSQRLRNPHHPMR